MATTLFTTEEKFRVTRILGIKEFDRLDEAVEAALDKIADPVRHDRAIEIMDSLDTFDAKILAAAERGNVKQVDTIHLDYSQALTFLKQEASRLLHELAWLLDLNIEFNKFTGQVLSGGGSGSKYSVRSLC